jgi:hypothetical protein
MAERRPVVCFGCYDYWHSNPGSPVQLMDAVHARGHQVLWINSIGMNLPRLGKRGFWKRVGLKLRSWVRWLRPHRPGFYVLAPVVLPLFGNPRVEKLNDLWLVLQIRLAYLLLGIRRPLAFVCMPSFAGAVARLPREGLIYYYTDKFDAYRDITARDAIRRRDRQLLTDADLVLCASEAIVRSLPVERPRVHHFPHAVDFPRFQAALASDAPPPADIAAIPSPRIGYFGSLTDSNDLEMIRHAATAAPELHFVLIGRVFGDYSAVAGLPNVHLLGFKPYDMIPHYGRWFDVGIMNWKLTEWIRHCNPVKTKEYLSLGLPIVSVRIAEVERLYPDLVAFAADGPEFLAAIRRVLAEDGPELRRRRQDRVRHETWAQRVEEMFALYEEAIGGA